jgi:hypothetical protein
MVAQRPVAAIDVDPMGEGTRIYDIYGKNPRVLNWPSTIGLRVGITIRVDENRIRGDFGRKQGVVPRFPNCMRQQLSKLANFSAPISPGHPIFLTFAFTPA